MSMRFMLIGILMRLLLNVLRMVTLTKKVNIKAEKSFYLRVNQVSLAHGWKNMK